MQWNGENCCAWADDDKHLLARNATAKCSQGLALDGQLAEIHVVVSLNRGTPIKTPKYYIPYSGDQNGTPNIGKPLFPLTQRSMCRVVSLQKFRSESLEEKGRSR